MTSHLFTGSKFNRDRREDSFARAVIAEAERRRRLVENNVLIVHPSALPILDQMIEEEKPLGDCPHCGSAYYDEQERQYHADAECIGGMERFR